MIVPPTILEYPAYKADRYYGSLLDQDQIVIFMVGMLSSNEEFKDMVPADIWLDIVDKFNDACDEEERVPEA